MITLYAVLFGVLFCSVFVWVFLCAKLFKMLETRHPEKYIAMGRPALIQSDSLASNIAFMKFLFKKEWLSMGDEALATLSRRMLVFICVFFAGFALLLLLPFIGRFLVS